MRAVAGVVARRGARARVARVRRRRARVPHTRVSKKIEKDRATRGARFDDRSRTVDGGSASPVARARVARRREVANRDPSLGRSNREPSLGRSTVDTRRRRDASRRATARRRREGDGAKATTR